MEIWFLSVWGSILTAWLAPEGAGEGPFVVCQLAMCFPDVCIFCHITLLAWVSIATAEDSKPETLTQSTSLDT
eukprot:4577214-Amphidinium_carterae.1